MPAVKMKEWPVEEGRAVTIKDGRILSAARVLFLSQGFGATSMDAIAQEANVSKTTIYAYYSSKEDLFAAIIEQECLRFASVLAGLDLDEKDLRAGLRGFGRGLLNIWLSPDSLAFNRLIVAETPRFPELGRISYERGPGKLLDQLTAYLSQATRAGALQISSPGLAADLLLGMFQGLVYSRQIMGIPETLASIDERIDAAIDIFLSFAAIDGGDKQTKGGTMLRKPRLAKKRG